MGGKRSFLFVSVGQPDGRPDLQRQKTVRSWVTKAQHDLRRRTESEQDAEAAAADAGGTDDREDEAETEQAVEPTDSAQSKKAPPVPPECKSEDAAPSPRPSSARRRKAGDPSRRRAQPKRSESRGDEGQMSLPIRSSPLQKTEPHTGDRQTSSDLTPVFPESTTPLDFWDSETLVGTPTSGLDDPSDTLSAYASQLETDPGTLWTHYLWQEREHGQLFRQNYRFNGSAASINIHPLILSDAAMLATTVLFTGCHLRYLRCQPIMNPALHRIHSLAYRFVQIALSSPATQLSNATLLAVIKLALFELFFGNRSAFDTHMHGMAQMVRFSGGIRGVDSYVAHILVWFDENFSAAAQTPPVLREEALAADMSSPFVDVGKFALGVDSVRIAQAVY